MRDIAVPHHHAVAHARALADLRRVMRMAFADLAVALAGADYALHRVHEQQVLELPWMPSVLLSESEQSGRVVDE